MSPTLLVLSSQAAGNPVMDATVGKHLQLVDIPPDRVKAIVSSGDKIAWASECHVVPVTPRWSWPARVAWTVRAHIKVKAPVTIYSRDEVTALAANLISRRQRRKRQIEVIFDKRGLPVAEALLTGKPKLLCTLLQLVERYNARRSDRVLCVTNALADHMERLGATWVTVVPNGFTDDLPTSVKRSGPAIAYIGGGQEWQCVDEVLDLLTRLGRYDDEVKTYVVTRDPSLTYRARLMGVDDYYLDHKSVPTFLDGVDAICVLRRPDAVSRAASPIKLGEALGRGCGIIATVDAWERLEELSNIAVKLVDLKDLDVQAVAAWIRRRHAMGEEARRLTIDSARKCLGLEPYRDDLRRFYGNAGAQ